MADVEPPVSKVVQPLAGSAASLGLSTFEGDKGTPTQVVDVVTTQGPPDTSDADKPADSSIQTSSRPAGSEKVEKPPEPADLSAVPGVARIPVDSSVVQPGKGEPSPDRPAGGVDGLNSDQLARLDEMVDKGDREDKRDKDKRDRLRISAGGVAQTPRIASTTTSIQPGRSVLPVQSNANLLTDSAAAMSTNFFSALFESRFYKRVCL